jgi:hypothetical protein
LEKRNYFNTEKNKIKKVDLGKIVEEICEKDQ